MEKPLARRESRERTDGGMEGNNGAETVKGEVGEEENAAMGIISR